MQQVDMIIQAKWIVPVMPRDKIYLDHGLIIDNNIIIDILPTTEIAQTYQSSTIINKNNSVLLPGFINSHTHIAMNLFRGYADDLKFMDWWQNRIFPAEQQLADEAFVMDGARLAIAEMFRSGTTCFNDMFYYPLSAAQAAQEAKIRSMIGFTILEFPTAWCQDAQDYLAKTDEAFSQHQANDLQQFVLAPHAPYSVADSTFKAILKLQEKHNSLIHIHVHETKDEVDNSVKEHGVRPLERLFNLGVLGEKTLAVHLTQLNDQEIKLLNQTNTQAIHSPASNMKLASGICPVSALLEAGVNVALGTDSVASNNDLSMLNEMRTAALLAKITAGEADVLPAQTCLEMATINGAKALGLDKQIGSLEIGKQADIIAVDLAQIETQPLYDIISQLVYATSRHQITDVWVAGQPCLTDRRLTTLDEDELINKANDWQQKIAAI